MIAERTTSLVRVRRLLAGLAFGATTLLGAAFAMAQEPEAESVPAEAAPAPGTDLEGTPAEAPADAGAGSTRARSTEDENRIKMLRLHAQRNIEAKRWREAIDEVKQLVVMSPFDSEYQLALGLLFRNAANLDEARRKYQDFMDLGGGKAVGHLLIAEAYAADGPKAKKEDVFGNLRKAAENGMNLMKCVEAFDRLKQLRSDTEFIKLALQLEHYQIDVELSDPMTNRFRKDTTRPTDLARKGQETTSYEEQRKIIQEGQGCLQKIQLALNTQDEAKAMAAYKRLCEIVTLTNKISDSQLKAALRKITADKEEIEARIQEIRLKYLYAKAQATVEDMAAAFKNEDFPKIQVLHAEAKLQAEEMTKINEAFREVALKINEVADEWLRKADVRREFSSKTLKIQGIVSEREVQYAIVNNQLLKVGQHFEDMLVIKIEPNRVLFRFKNENVPLIFRRY